MIAEKIKQLHFKKQIGSLSQGIVKIFCEFPKN